MLCEICGKNEASGYYRHTVNGNTKSVKICSSCFYEKQSEFLGALNTFSGYVDTGGKKQKCSKCGRRLDEIKKTLFVGCPHCYAELEAQLEPLINNLHSACRHTGASPHNAVLSEERDFEQSKEAEIAKLREQLKRAIEEERYEDAEDLSGKIKRIKALYQQ